MAEFTIGFDKLGIDLSKLNSTGYTTCPECSKDRKQANRNSKVLKVYPLTGYYKCNHCDFDGRVDSNEWIEEQHGIETGLIQKPQYKAPEPIQMKPFITNELNKQAIDFLAARGISEQTAKNCGVSQQSGCLAFNYYKGSKIVGAKYRKMDSKFFWQHAGCEKFLYGLNDIEGQDTIIIVEGEFDKLAFYEAGFKNCVSVAQGAPNEGSDIGSKLQCLDNSIDYIKNVKKVILACDNDPNGKYLSKVLVERFGADRCALVEFPEGCKDANDILLTYGVDGLKNLVNSAKDTPIQGVTPLQDVRSEMMDIYNNGFRKGESTGISGLDGHFSFYKPWWNLIYGIPNSGKSAFAFFLMMSMSVSKGWKWACFCPEAYPAEDFYTDAVKILTGKEIEPNKPNRLTDEEYNVAMDFISKHFFFIYPADYKNAKGEYLSNSVDTIIDTIRELKLSKGIDGFLIDPFNQMTKSSNEKGNAKDEHLEEALGKIDHLCKTHSLCGNVIAHPTKMYKDKGEIDYKKPTPYECAGGAMWYNKAYCIICVHRFYNQSDKANPLVEIDIQKVKSHKRVGRPASVEMAFDPYTEWYNDLNTPVEFCALGGKFEEIAKANGIQSKNTFTSKMQQDLSQSGYDHNKCPF